MLMRALVLFKLSALTVIVSLVISACSSVSLDQPTPTGRPSANSGASATGPKIIRLNEGVKVTTNAGQAENQALTAKTEIKPGFYEVKKGDTLYSIALESGQTYRDLAAWNNLADPNLIKVGQILRVQAENEISSNTLNAPQVTAIKLPSLADPKPSPSNTGTLSNPTGIRTAPNVSKQPYSEAAWQSIQAGQSGTTTGVSPSLAAKSNAPSPVASSTATNANKAEEDSAIIWAWPVGNGSMVKIAQGFTENRYKGIDIDGKLGDPVFAAADGEISYVGNALPGYGNLVIMRHNKLYLSAYAHNDKILVKEGQIVKRGQKIAEIGKSDSESPKLHFEIRRQGKPVDPVKFLPQ